MTQPDDRRLSHYEPHEKLVADARRYPAIWRLILGVFTALFVTGYLFEVVDSTVGQAIRTDGSDNQNRYLNLLYLGSFACIIAGVAVAAGIFQRRWVFALIGPLTLATRQFLTSLKAVFFLICAILVLPPYGLGIPLQNTQSFSTWLAFVPISLAAIFVQVSAEEIGYRGYLQQSLAARFRSPLIWMVVPSIMFGLDHYRPHFGDNAWLVVFWATLFGLLCADLTARSGTLGPAIAMHFGNNVFVILIVSLTNESALLSLYHVNLSAPDTTLMRQWLFVDFFVLFVLWLTVRVAIRR